MQRKVQVRPVPEARVAQAQSPHTAQRQPAQTAQPAEPRRRRAPMKPRSRRMLQGGLLVAVLGLGAYAVQSYQRPVDGSTTCGGKDLQWRGDEFRMRPEGAADWGEWTFRGSMDRSALCAVAAETG